MAESITKIAQPELNSEFANRLRDPFEALFMGVIQTNDPLLMERGAGPEIYRDLKRDGKVFDGLQKRQLALIGKPWQVEPRVKSAKGTSDAESVTAILKGCNFDRLCAELLEALIAGFVTSEIVWTVRDGLVVPERVVKRAQRRFKFVQRDENSPPRLHMLTRESMLTGIPVPDRKFIVHRVNAEDDNPYGTGLGLQLYWPVFFKRKAVVSWNKLNDRVGGPTLHGEYPRNATKKEKDTLADALRAFSSDGFVITPEGMKVALIESKLSGNVTMQQALCEYMDDWIGAVLTGQEARSSSGGALAAASKERADVREDLTQADSDLLSETLNSTLLAWICELNGLEPCHVWRQVKQEDDTKSMAETDKIVSDMGFELSLDAVRARYGEGWEKKAEPTVVPPQLQPMVKPGQPGLAANFAEPDTAETDALDALAEQDWEPLVDSLVSPLQAVIDESVQRGESAAQLLDRLPGLLDMLGDQALHRALTKSTFAARLGAVAGLASDGSGSAAAAFAEPRAHADAAAAPAPTIEVHVHPTIQMPEQPAPQVTVTNQVAPTPVSVEVQVPEQAAPAVQVVNQVQPAAVTVIDNHPTRAEQVVQRDENDEIVKTVTTYTRTPAA
jgi:phage gp29-like protein